MCTSLPFGYESGMWDVIVSVPGYCHSLVLFRLTEILMSTCVQYLSRISLILSFLSILDLNQADRMKKWAQQMELPGKWPSLNRAWDSHWCTGRGSNPQQ